MCLLWTYSIFQVGVSAFAIGSFLVYPEFFQSIGVSACIDMHMRLTHSIHRHGILFLSAFPIKPISPLLRPLQSGVGVHFLSPLFPLEVV